MGLERQSSEVNLFSRSVVEQLFHDIHRIIVLHDFVSKFFKQLHISGDEQQGRETVSILAIDVDSRFTLEQ